MAVFRPAPAGGEPAPAARVIQRSRARDFSDAEAVILLHRDSPA
jgi:hypothetical protein